MSLRLLLSVFLPQFLSTTRSILGKQGFSLIMRPSIYAQFVAGESEGEIAVAMEKMRSLGLRTMLAVPIEEDLGESTGFDHKHSSSKQLSNSARFTPNCPLFVCIENLCF